MAGLHVLRSGHGPRLALLHGFTQTAACWPEVAPALAADHEVVAVDLPRHGGSRDVGGDLDATADLLADAVGPAVWLGYSLGARCALTLAVTHPEVVRGLVLVSGTAGLRDDRERRERRAVDEARATALERDGLDAFLATWLDQPLFADVPPERRCEAERATNDAAALAASLREVGTGRMRPLWDDLAEVRAPALLVAGALDERYVALAHELAAHLGGPTRVVIVPDTGHAVGLVRPEALLGAVATWEADGRAGGVS